MKHARSLMVFAMIAISSLTNAVFAQALNPLIDLVEFKIDRVESGSQYLYLDSEKTYFWPGFCANGANARLCGPNSGPDYRGTELALIDYLGSDPTHPNYLPYARTGKVWPVFRVGAPNTVAVHRIWVRPWGSHVYVSSSEVVNGENALTTMSRMPDVFTDNGVSFAVKQVYDGFADDWLKLPQACGGEKQTGLTPMIRSYSRNPIGNHQLTTRTDATYFEQMRNLPGWANAVRDMDTTGGQAGVWCVPSQSDKLVQSTSFSNAPGDGQNGVWLQLQVHDLSLFSLSAGNQISLPLDYAPLRYSTTRNSDLTWTGQFDADPNRGVIALSRGLGGYVEYGGEVSQPLSVLPKSTLSVVTDWSTVTIDEESGVVYGMSIGGVSPDITIRFHAYDPKENRYVWNYTVPEQYRQYYSGESKLHSAGQYLVTYFQTRENNRTLFRGALLVFGNVSSETPSVQIFDLPGPNHNITDFSYDAEANVGYFANARDRSLHKLDFNDWPD